MSYITHGVSQDPLYHLSAAIERGEKVQFMEDARNVNRSVGAMLSGELIKHRPEGLPDQTIFIQMEGTGGQSFGA